jgi:ring-1,2-phenylacetyl-CoA epoxidase subunit PaaE
MSESSQELVPRRVKIRLYGQDHEFDVQPDETFLSAAQRANLDPPYACQIGACCTCRAKLVSGSAIMDEREALSDDEIDDGYILTCQAHPTSDGCFADYDQ